MENKSLKKSMGLFSAISIVVGSVIGAGVFFKPYAIYQSTGGAPGMGMLAWIIGGLASLCAALTFAEIAVLKPRTGGMIAYLEEVYDKRLGFLAGWMQVIIFYPAALSGYGVTIGTELSAFIGDGFILPVAICTISALVILNILGAKAASRLQIIFTICKLIPLFVLMIFGFVLGDGGNPIFSPMISKGTKAGAAMGSTLLAVLFAFEGWTNIGALAGEMKNPAKDLPKTIVGGVSIIMFVYFIINIAYLWVLPADELMNLKSPASAVAVKIFGNAGGKIVIIGIIISVIGAANGFLMSGSRVAFFLAENKTLPFSNTLSRVNSQSVPSNSIILIGVLACIYSISGQFDTLTNIAVFSCWIFYTLTFMSVMTLRRKEPNLNRTYKVPLYPVIPILAIVGGLFVIFNQLFMSGWSARILALLSIGVTLIGLPVYYGVKKYYSSHADKSATKDENTYNDSTQTSENAQ